MAKKKKRSVSKNQGNAGKTPATPKSSDSSGNKKRTSRRTQRQEQLAQEQRNKTLRTWIPIGLLGVALLAFILFRVFQPDVEGIVESSGLSRDHDTSATFADESLPPVGGVHYPNWQNCGIYDQELDKALAVHSLEHGGIWIAYNPEIPESDLDTLRDITREDSSWVLLSPYPDLAADVVVSAWGKQLVTDGANDERIPDFIRRYLGQGPEPGVTCTNGVGTPLS